MASKNSFLFFISLTFCLQVSAQDVTNFTQFFINPYTINPSYAGIEGKSSLFLGYRKQWATIVGGPTISGLSFHTPLGEKVGFGFQAANDTKGLLENSLLALSASYTVNFDTHKFIRFGLSAGGAWNRIDLAKLEAFLGDPALMGQLDKSFSLYGSAGISFHVQSFHAGITMPQIFQPSYVSPDPFSITEVKPFQSVIVHASNRFYFDDNKHVFEPYLIYRVNNGLPSQFEFAGVLHLNHMVWVGGSYKQDFGISALGGVKINGKFAIGGSYTLKNSGINNLASPSYEAHLSLLLGERRKNTVAYSFVSTIKEKEKKQVKTAQELLAEKKKKEELAKKQEAEALAKKQQGQQSQQTRVQQEEAARRQQAEQARVQQEEAARRQQAEQARVQQEDAARRQQAEQVRVQQEEAARRRQAELAKAQEDSLAARRHAHTGGPRLKAEMLLTDVLTDDAAHHEDEQEKLSRLNIHANEPKAKHTDDPSDHPHADRHEIVKKGGHQEELEVGDYVIAAVFRSDANADHFVAGLKKMGFKADYGHLTEKNLWYVYISQSNDINKAKKDRDRYRQYKVFRDSWLLTVHH